MHPAPSPSVPVDTAPSSAGPPASRRCTRILDDSDNRRVECAALPPLPGPSHQSADGVSSKAKLLCERLVDEGNLRGVHRVGFGELTSGNEGDVQDADRRDRLCVIVRIWSGLEPLLHDTP